MEASENDDTVGASASDAAEFGRFFDAYYTTIHGYLTRRLGPTRADDLAGEVFRVAFESFDRYDATRGGVRPWLYCIANNVLRRSLCDGERAERAWARLPKTVTDNGLERVEDDFDARLRVAVLQQALDRLLPTDREALFLFAVEQLTYEEIADVMDTPVGTVRSRISRARSQLRDHLATTPITNDPQGATCHG